MGKHKVLTREEYAEKFNEQMNRFNYIPQEGEVIVQAKAPYPDYWFVSNKGYVFTAYYKDVQVLCDNPTEQGLKNKAGKRAGKKWRYRSSKIPGGDVPSWKVVADHFCKCEFSGYEGEEKDIHHIQKRATFQPDEGHLCNRADNLQILPKSVHKELTKFSSKTSEEYDKEIEAKIKKSGCPQYYTNDLMSLIEPLLKELKKNGAAGAIYLMDESDPNNIKAKAYTLNDIEFIED